MKMRDEKDQEIRINLDRRNTFMYFFENIDINRAHNKFFHKHKNLF